MAAPAYLKVTLKLMALYAGIMAALALFFQEAGAFIFGYAITDPVTTRYWGGVLFAMAIFYLFLSYDPDKYKLFVWIGIFDLGVAMVLTIINIANNNITLLQGITGMFLNPIFIILLLAGVAKKPEGEVILVSGPEKKGGESELHASHHPLHHK